MARATTSTAEPLNGSVGCVWSSRTGTSTPPLRFADDMDKVGKDARGTTTSRAQAGVVDLYAQFAGAGPVAQRGVFNLFDKEYVSYESITGLAATADTSKADRAHATSVHGSSTCSDGRRPA